MVNFRLILHAKSLFLNQRRTNVALQSPGILFHHQNALERGQAENTMKDFLDLAHGFRLVRVQGTRTKGYGLLIGTKGKGKQGKKREGVPKQHREYVPLLWICGTFVHAGPNCHRKDKDGNRACGNWSENAPWKMCLQRIL